MVHPEIEKLAIRMVHARYGDPDNTPEEVWSWLNESDKRGFITMAEAAHRHILSEPPSEAMVAAWGALPMEKVQNGLRSGDWKVDCSNSYTVMNRARLRELGLGDGTGSSQGILAHSQTQTDDGKQAP